MPSSSPSYTPRTGPSRATLIVLGTLTTLVILCCGGGVYLFSRVRFDETSDKAAVERIAGTIMQVQLPEGYQPDKGIEADYLIYRCQFAGFASPSGLGQLVLLSIDVSLGGADLNQARQEMQTQGSISGELENATTETLDVTIDGETVPVTFSTGILKPAEGAPEKLVGKDCFSIEAVIPREAGLVLFSALGPRDEYDRAAFESAVRSIRLPETDAP